MRNDYLFKWNGIDISAFLRTTSEGKRWFAIVRQAPTMTYPKRRYKTYTVPGRSGDIYIPDESYDNFTKSYELFLYGMKNDPYEEEDPDDPLPSFDGRTNIKDLTNICWQIQGWLTEPKGYATLQDDETGINRTRLAYYTGNLNVAEDLLRFGRATISFSVRPELFIGDPISGYKTLNITSEERSSHESPTRGGNAKPLISISIPPKQTITDKGQTIVKRFPFYVYCYYGRNSYNNYHLNHWQYNPPVNDSWYQDEADYLVIDSEGQNFYLVKGAANEPVKNENVDLTQWRLINQYMQMIDGCSYERYRDDNDTLPQKTGVRMPTLFGGKTTYIGFDFSEVTPTAREFNIRERLYQL